MTDWQKMFQGVQTIIRTTEFFETGLKQTIAFARNDTKEYDDLEYWHKVERLSDRLPASTVIGWAREGLENLDYTQNWDFLFLDLGDCPESFNLYSLDCQNLFIEDRFRKLIFTESVIEFSEFVECLSTKADDFEKELYNCKRLDWVYHNVKELKDDILSWNIDSVDYKGNNGYLLWLAFGCLACVESLRKQEYCKKILRGRNKLYLLSGFEEIFFYLGTATPAGMVFETVEGVSGQITLGIS